MSLEDVIMGGIVFKGKKEGLRKGENKVKTEAREAAYMKGTHDSGTAKVKARIR